MALNKTSKILNKEFFILLIINLSATVISAVEKISFWKAIIVFFVIILKITGAALTALILLAVLRHTFNYFYRSIKKFKIDLYDRGEALSYEDEFGLYTFTVYQGRNIISLHLPCGKNDTYHYALTQEERERIFPRIRSYFFPICWFGFIPWFYKLQIIEEQKNQV